MTVQRNTIVDVSIGGISGIVSRTMTAPIELYKIQKQSTHIVETSLYKVFTEEGIRGLWKGNGVNCVRLFPHLGINFSLYNMCKTNSFFDSNNKLHHFTAGCIGGTISTALIYPLETIRSRLSVQENKSVYNGLFDAYRKMTFNELYRGVHVGICGFVPFNAFNFVFYTELKRMFSSQIQTPLILHCLSGGFAGVLSVSITYPTDVIRRRMQLHGIEESHCERYTMRDAIRAIHAEKGMRGFYAGLLPCYLKLFPTIAIQFTVIEQLKKMYYV
jgi:solute carrier family 25 (mitochondrial phosphate transporter), member 23/24/25/41